MAVDILRGGTPDIDARQAGYSWDEIQDHVGQASAEAAGEGYSQEEIDQHLGGTDPGPLEDVMRNAWKNEVARNPEIDVSDLGEHPDAAGLYAHGLLTGAIQGPQDYAERFAAHMANAAGVDRQALPMAAAAADEYASGLPAKRDFTDAAISVGGDDIKNTRDNLIRNWRDTGQDPIQAAIEASRDDDVAAALKAKNTPGFFDQFGTEVKSIVGGLGQLTTHILPQGFLDALGSVNNSLVDAGILKGRVNADTWTPEHMDAFVKARDEVLKKGGYDDASLGGITAQIAVGAPLFATLGFEGLGAAIIGGATGGLAMGALKPNTAEDFWTGKAEQLATEGVFGAAGGAALHGAIAGIGKLVKTMAPAALDVLDRMAYGLLNPKVDVIHPEEGLIQRPVAETLEPVRPAAPKVTLGDAQDVEGRFNQHEILDENGQRAGYVQISRAEHAPEDVAPGEAHVDMIKATSREGEADLLNADKEDFDEGKNTFGPRVMRELARQYFEKNPGIDTISGFRMSGARGKANAADISLTRDQVMGPGKRFDPEATPAEKVEAIARDEPHDGTPDFYERKATELGEDPKTVELAQATDGGIQMRGAFAELMSRVMRDEGGGVPLPALRTAQQIADAQAAANDRNFARTAVVRMMGERNQAIFQLGKRLQPFLKAVQPHLGEWQDEIAKGPAGNPSTTVVGKLLDYVEGRSQGVAIDPNHLLKPYADVIREVNQAVDKRLRQQAEDGVINYDGYIHDYFVHKFADPAKALDTFGPGSGKLGSRGNLMQRDGPPTITDALRSGIPLRDSDPYKMIMDDITAKLSYSHAADAVDALREAGQLRWTPSRQPGDVELGTGFGRKLFVDGSGDPREIKLYGSPQTVDAIQKIIDRGLHNNTTTGGILDGLNYAKNATTSIAMMVPLFHGITIGIGSIAGGIAKSFEEATRGQVLEAVGSLLSAPGSAIFDARAGMRFMRQYADGTGNAVVQSMVRNNVRIGGQHELERYSRAPGIYTSIRNGTLSNELKADVANIAGNPQTETPLMRTMLAAPRAADFALKEATRLTSVWNEPFFDHAIPTLKLGQISRRAESWLAANPAASSEQLDEAVRKISMDVDNRLGELQLDNVFWSRTAKQLVNTATISTSWTYGTYRGLMQAFGYDLERRGFAWNPGATGALIGTMSTFAGANAIMNYLHTGEAPQDWRDLANYRTGGRTKAGDPERGMVPSELKEVFDIGSIIAKTLQRPAHLPEATIDYVLGKLNPGWQFIRQLAFGSNYGPDWRADKEGMLHGLGQLALKSFMPIAASTVQQLNDNPATGITGPEAFAGFHAAAGWVQNFARYQANIAKHDAFVNRTSLNQSRTSGTAGPLVGQVTNPGRAENGVRINKNEPTIYTDSTQPKPSRNEARALGYGRGPGGTDLNPDYSRGATDDSAAVVHGAGRSTGRTVGASPDRPDGSPSVLGSRGGGDRAASSARSRLSSEQLFNRLRTPRGRRQ